MQSWILLSDVGDEDGRPRSFRVCRRARPVLAGPRASRHHELPPRGDVRRGGGLDDRSRRNPVRVSDRRTAPGVAHHRRTIEPLFAPHRLRRVGTARDRPCRLGRARDATRLVRDRRAASPRERSVFGFPAPGDRTGTSRPWPTPNALPPGRSHALPLSRPRRREGRDRRCRGSVVLLGPAAGDELDVGRGDDPDLHLGLELVVGENARSVSNDSAWW